MTTSSPKKLGTIKMVEVGNFLRKACSLGLTDYVLLMMTEKRRIYCFFVCLFLFLSFQGCTCDIWRFPGQESKKSCSCRPILQPQQLGIQAMFATYTTTHGNTGSLTHGARPGIKPAYSWMLVRFVSTEPEFLYFYGVLIRGFTLKRAEQTMEKMEIEWKIQFSKWG